MAFGAILGQRPGVQSVNNVLPDVQGNVTLNAGNVGAAPAGYGLGADSVKVDSWDNATKNGFYRSSGGSFTGDAHGIVVSYPYGEGTCDQLAWSTWNNTNEMATRRIHNGVPREWEYINPPMEAGVEFRTTQRYLGKPVYTKIIHTGVVTNATYVKLGLDYNVKIIGQSSTWLGGGIVLPFDTGSEDTKLKTNLLVDSGEWKCYVICGARYSGRADIAIQVWYTKN